MTAVNYKFSVVPSIAESIYRNIGNARIHSVLVFLHLKHKEDRFLYMYWCSVLVLHETSNVQAANFALPYKLCKVC